MKKVVAVILVIVMCFSFCACGSSSSSGGHKTTCKSCGRTFEAGDAAGNYMNIARTGMCNNCEGNYHAMKGYLD